MDNLLITFFEIVYNEPMPKESKNLGITKACPECRKILIKSANIIGNGSFKTKCPHCNSFITISIGQKTFINVFKAVSVIILVISAVQLFVLNGLNQKFAYLINNYVSTINK